MDDAPNTRPENEWWEGIPSKLLKLWDKGVIFGVFAGDGLSKESVIIISKLDELEGEVGSQRGGGFVHRRGTFQGHDIRAKLG